MRTTQLLTTVAATVLLGTGIAAAQGMNGPVKPERAPATQQNAPAEKMAPNMHAGQRGAAETTGQGETEGSTHALKPGAGGNTKLDAHGTVGASPQSGAESGRTNGAKVEEDSHAKAGAKTDKTDMKAQENGKHETNGKESNDAHANATTGQGAAASSAKLTTTQRTKITTIIKQKKVEPTHLDISVHVGVHVPEHVHYYPLPTQVVEIYPEWRGYDYILVSDQILVVDPDTHVVVAILET